MTNEKRRIAIIVDVGLGLLCLLIGLLFLAKAGDPDGLLADASKGDAWRGLLPAAVAFLLAGLLRAGVAWATIAGVIVWVGLAILMLVTAVAKNQISGKTVLFVLALLACAGVHFDVSRTDRSS